MTVRASIRGFCLLSASLALAGCAGRSLDRSGARQALMQIPGMNLSKENVYVEGVTQIDKENAVAEANIKTAFKLKKSGGEWIVSEVRLDEGQWVPVADLYQQLSETQVRRTREDMNRIALGLERFRLVHARYPEAKDFLALMDQIYPHYISAMVGRDAWSQPFHYRLDGATRYTITSAGPDGKIGTNDDIVVTSARD